MGIIRLNMRCHRGKSLEQLDSLANPVDGKSKKKIASSIHSMLEPPLFAMKELFQQTHRICTVILYLLAMQLISILPYRSVFLHY
ncbi:hypothetical protein, partial [Chromobacterium subtsugae]|uniref:hypothetical protein n=1 Tax=Chromobacterium subtsugae TaxID=251747 RepID=UPI001F1A822E